MSEVIKVVLGLTLLAGVVLLLFTGCGYNISRQELCEKHDMVMVQDYFNRGYGCGEVIPFEELEE